MQNPSGINPTEYNVLVKQHDIGEKIGSVYIADTTKDRKQAMATRATLVAVSPLAFSYDRWPEGTRLPEVGDTVIITKAAGVSVEGEDGATYRLIKDKDIAAVVGVSGYTVADLNAEIVALNVEAQDGR